jgi:hypothetical protein
MCYSARCLWENYFGDCSYPHHLKNINAKYYCGIELQDYLHIQRQITRDKRVLERKNKIISLKTKL